MASASQKDFVAELKRLLTRLVITDGTKSEIKLSPDGTGGTAVLRGWGENTATIAWDADLSWTVYIDKDGKSRKIKSGTYPKQNFSFQVLSASGVIAKPPSVQVGRTNAAIKFILSFTALSAILLLGKILIISSDSRSIPQIPSIATAQELLGSFSFEDLVNIVLGLALANGVLSLILVSAVSYAIYRQSYPDYVLGSDNVGWGAGLLLLLGIGPFTVSLLLADWPWKFCIAGGAALIYWADRLRTGLPRELEKWRKYGTWVERSPGFAGHKCNYDWDTEYQEELPALGQRLAQDTRELQEKLYLKREEIHSDQDFKSLFTRTEMLYFVLKTEVARITKKKPRSYDDTLRKRRKSFKLRKVRDEVAQAELYFPLIIMLAFFVLMNDRPWMPPLCLEEGGEHMTVYEVSAVPPRYLVDSDRSIKYSSFNSGEKLTQGACDSGK